MNGNMRMNIMTSCDQKLAKQLPVLLQSIADQLSDREVHFYLFHSSIERDTISRLEKFCKVYENITFHEVVISSPDAYIQLAGPGGGWNGEAYYSLCAHELLPDIDRIMYVDAGDVIIAGNIDDYYYGEFEGKSLLVTGARYKSLLKYILLYDSDDMGDPELLKGILRGLFNSGSYILNLEKMRVDGYTMADFQFLSNRLMEFAGEDGKAYWGDQGLLSAAYVGDMEVYGFPEVASVWYMPYNFCLWYFNAFDEKPDYETRVIHYAGSYKPWRVKYDTFLTEFQSESELNEMSSLKAAQREYYLMWYRYAVKAEQIMKTMER